MFIKIDFNETMKVNKISQSYHPCLSDTVAT